MKLQEGIYEQVINSSIAKELKSSEGDVDSYKEKMDEEEASHILSSYICEKIKDTLDCIHDTSNGLDEEVALINEIVNVLHKYGDQTEDYHIENIDHTVDILDAIVKKSHSSFRFHSKHPVKPETSIARSSLFTGSASEPKLYSEFQKEIESSDSIDMLVSFIKWTGIRNILPQLKAFANRGGKLRIISTTYTGATDAKAINELSKIPGCEVKISYDTKATRLHAKTYVFHRHTGFTTAYIGSSNLSNQAMSDGLEWNMKITEKDLPETFRKIDASFNSYWHSDDFETYHSDQDFKKLQACLDQEKYHDNPSIHLNYHFDIHPYSYQKEILDQLDAERKIRGHYRNLVVAATGTGKTVISAFDYKRFVSEHPAQPNRLLFIAHREEILKQSLACFRGVLKDANFGDLLVGKYQNPEDLNHLFASIQSVNSNDLISHTSPDYYDFIILDESHHDAAPGYQKLLSYYKPKILLGLTATPERMDGQSILKYFDNRIAAEIRLPEAIDRKLLAPFQYYAVTDVVDLNDLKWQNGGYVKKDLENAYIGTPSIAVKRADAILNAVDRYVADLREVKGLGFCVTKKHAEYMAAYFTKHGVQSKSLTADTDPQTRKDAAKELAEGKLHFIFTVDLYNEGVDIPEVNTILFLRPTESLTVFLQQLGRGLRLSEGKDYLTVLDFIGQANHHYNFEDRFAALLERTHRDVTEEIKKGFLYLPKGCSVMMEKVAQEHILENIKASYQGGFLKRIQKKMRTFSSDYNVPFTLSNFYEYTHIDPRDLYGKTTFYQAEADAGIISPFHESLNDHALFAKALRRVAWIDSRRWIDYLLGLLTADALPTMPRKDSSEYRMLKMFQYTVWNQSYEECGFDTLLEGIRIIRENSYCCKELIELLMYQREHIDFVDQKVDLGFDCPLDLHCTYTRDQLFTALDYDDPHRIREGVKYLPDKKIDVFLITLNKSSKDYSPTTLYNDYSENEYLFHWQSQSTTSDTSKTGQRYIHHQKLGSKVLLFVREYKNRGNQASNETEPYAFLGTASYVSHTGSKPMDILWKLDEPIPGKYLRHTNKLFNA